MSIFNNFPAVGAGGDTSDATATPADLLEGKTAYGADGKITGTIPSVEGKQIVPKAAGQIAVAGNVYTTGARIIPKEDNFIPANIRKDVSIWGVVGTLDPGSTPTPDPNLIPANVKAGVTIDGVTGTFTNDANATAESMQQGVSAYVNGERVVGTAPIQAAKTVRPTTTEQTAVASGSFTSGAVKVEGDANLVADNIKEGVSIFGVLGRLAGGGGEVQGKFVNVGNSGSARVLLSCNFTPTWALIGGHFEQSGGQNGAMYLANGVISRSTTVHGAIENINLQISGKNVQINRGGFSGCVIAGSGTAPNFDTTPY